MQRDVQQRRLRGVCGGSPKLERVGWKKIEELTNQWGERFVRNCEANLDTMRNAGRSVVSGSWTKSDNCWEF